MCNLSVNNLRRVITVMIHSEMSRSQQLFPWATVCASGWTSKSKWYRCLRSSMEPLSTKPLQTKLSRHQIKTLWSVLAGFKKLVFNGSCFCGVFWIKKSLVHKRAIIHPHRRRSTQWTETHNWHHPVGAYWITHAWLWLSLPESNVIRGHTTSHARTHAHTHTHTHVMT